MKHYEVDWTIELEADNPIAAAEKARAIMRDPEQSWAGVFRVFDENGDVTEVGLDLGGEAEGEDDA